MSSFIDEVSPLIEEWCRECQKKYLHTSSPENCEHYLLTAEMTVDGNKKDDWLKKYGEWIGARWHDDSTLKWSQKLNEKFIVKLSGVHYKTEVVPGHILLTPFTTTWPNTGKELSAYSTTILQSNFHKKHLANKLFQGADRDNFIHIRLKSDNSTISKKTNKLVEIKPATLNFILNHFVVCHLYESINKLIVNLDENPSIKTDLDKTFKRFKKLKAIGDKTEFNEFLESLLVSFYVSFSLEKQNWEKDQKEIQKENSILFQNSSSIDYIFIPVIYDGNVRAVIPSIHEYNFNTEEFIVLQKIYKQIVLEIINWERNVKDAEVVKSKLKKIRENFNVELDYIVDRLKSIDLPETLTEAPKDINNIINLLNKYIAENK